jgi:hypothetical protein
LLVGTFGLEQTRAGLSYSFNGGFTDASQGALQFWLAQTLMLAPAGLLLGWALAPLALAPLTRAWRALGDPRHLGVGLALVALLGTLTFRLLHAGVLLDYAITDDERGARFGGQVLALGRLSVPWPVPTSILEPHFMFPMPEGGMNSFEWPGLLLSWALAELTGLGPWVFMAASGVTLATFGLLVGRRAGPAWGWLACALFALSPMASALSWTTHGHVISRMFLALALWCAWEWSRAHAHKGWAAGLGLSWGAALLTRTPESALLMLPLAGWLALTVAKARAWGALAAGVAGLAGPLALYAIFNWLWTGVPWEIARISPRAFGDFAAAESLWWRFGSNLSYNLLMLLVWGLGPLGGALLWLGAGRDAFARAVAAGLGLGLGLCLAHTSVGITIVGPIHYSDAAVAWVFLAVEGLRVVARWLDERDIGRSSLVALVAALVLGAGAATIHNAAQLRRQATVHATLFGFIEQDLAQRKVERAVIFAPMYVEVWRGVPPLAKVGSFVYDWPLFEPGGENRLVFMGIPKTGEELEAVHQAFPDHALLVLNMVRDAPWLALVPLDKKVVEP